MLSNWLGMHQMSQSTLEEQRLQPIYGQDEDSMSIGARNRPKSNEVGEVVICGRRGPPAHYERARVGQ